MPKYGRFQFADDAEITRSAGSDWIYDKSDQWRKLRGWDSAASKWNVTKVSDMRYSKCPSFPAGSSTPSILTRAFALLAVFYDAEKFNSDVSKWNVAKVSTMHASKYHSLLL